MGARGRFHSGAAPTQPAPSTSRPSSFRETHDSDISQDGSRRSNRRNGLDGGKLFWRVRASGVHPCLEILVFPASLYAALNSDGSYTVEAPAPHYSLLMTEEMIFFLFFSLSWFVSGPRGRFGKTPHRCLNYPPPNLYLR